MIIINLNGPAKSGKDTLCKGLIESFDRDQYVVIHMEFKELLFDIAVRTAGITRKLWDALYEREYKEKPCPYLLINGDRVSPRQWMIHCSENVMKPVFGEDVFGKAFVNKLKEVEAEMILGEDQELVVVVSDGGFLEESIPVVETVGVDNYFLVRIHRFDESGEEYSFAGDSRRYLFAKEFPDGLTVSDTDIVNLEGNVQGTVNNIINFVEKLRYVA